MWASWIRTANKHEASMYLYAFDLSSPWSNAGKAFYLHLDFLNQMQYWPCVVHWGFHLLLPLHLACVCACAWMRIAHKKLAAWPKSNNFYMWNGAQRDRFKLYIANKSTTISCVDMQVLHLLSTNWTDWMCKIITPYTFIWAWSCSRFSPY